jgi:hypothetical protein
MTRHTPEWSTSGRGLALGSLVAVLVVSSLDAQAQERGIPVDPSTGLQQPAETAHALTGEQVVERVAPAVVMILVGQGSGQLAGVGSGVIVGREGMLLTAYHVVKDAKEIQVRLKNHEIYDNVDLMAVDERRDIAALRLRAAGSEGVAIAPADAVKPGETVYVVSNPEALGWTASAGVLSASRLADEVPGAGTGYRILQFTAPVSPGSSGGALVDAQGRLLGIVVASKSGQNLNFAVPIESVLGLANAKAFASMGSGKDLSLPVPTHPPQSSAIAKADPVEMIRSIRTFCVLGSHEFPAEPLEKKLLEKEEFRSGHWLLVKDRRSADLIIELDRKVLTWDFTYRMTHQSTGIILGAGKAIKWDGVRAAPEIANQIVARLRYLAKSSEPNLEQREEKGKDKK